MSEPVKPTKKKSWVVGFGPETITPGETRTIQTWPGVFFRGQKVINAGDEDDLFFKGFFVGSQSQFPNGVDAPFSELRAQRLTDDLRYDACLPTLSMSIIVENRGSVDRKCNVAVIGEAIIEGRTEEQKQETLNALRASFAEGRFEDKK